MTLTDKDRTAFHRLLAACETDALGLVETTDAATGDYRAVVCIMAKEASGDTIAIPVAVLLWDDPAAILGIPDGAEASHGPH